MNEATRFYQELYTSKTKASQGEAYDNTFFFEDNDCYLNDIEREQCEGLLTAAECLESLKTMESNKTPGTDGIPADFYKVFWNDIKPFFLASINASFEKGLLSISQRRGLITLIPKKDKPKCSIKNWRPISLLNCDYKIAAKSIANRIKKTLPSIINSDQTGFLKNRFIGENIRLLNYIISYTEKVEIPGLLLFIDFEKAFDTLEWPFIEKTLKYFNFGGSLISWINLFYTDISSCIQNNGWSSDFFPLTRGVRQGCPLSPYLFLLCAEILGTAVRRDDEVKGIQIYDKECKVSQYADDTTLILNGSQSSVERSFLLLDAFAQKSGLKVNYEKTEALWIGTHRNRTDKLPIKRNIKWPFQKTKALGVWFSTAEEETVTLNYQERKGKIINILNSWQFRRLTLLGKITVIKCLAASQLVYIMSPLTSSKYYLKEIHRLFFNFLWDGKGDKFKRSEIINDYENGGLNMLDIQTFNRALKAKWITKYLDNSNNGKWKFFFDHFLAQQDTKLLLTGNLKPTDVNGLNIQDDFTKELVEIWTELNYEENPDNFERLPIWYNSLLRVANQPIFYRDWSRAGINHVKDILNQDSNFLSFADFKTRYQVKTSFLKYYGVVSSIKNIRKQDQHYVADNSENESTGLNLLSVSNLSRVAYKRLLQKISSTPLKSQDKWLKDCNIDGELINWKSTYALPFQCTRETKLRVFQFKLLHRRIATNNYLSKIGLSSTDICNFCEEKVETLIHLFWECSRVQIFWQKVQSWLIEHKVISQNFPLPQLTCLGFINKTNGFLVHHALLLGRFHIYTSKLNKTLPNLRLFSQSVLKCQDIEKRYAVKTNTTKKFKAKWESFIA